MKRPSWLPRDGVRVAIYLAIIGAILASRYFRSQRPADDARLPTVEDAVQAEPASKTADEASQEIRPGFTLFGWSREPAEGGGATVHVLAQMLRVPEGKDWTACRLALKKGEAGLPAEAPRDQPPSRGEWHLMAFHLPSDAADAADLAEAEVTFEDWPPCRLREDAQDKFANIVKFYDLVKDKGAKTE